MKIKKLSIHIIANLAIALFLLFSQAAAEMWVMTEEELDRQSVKTDVIGEVAAEADTETDELLKETEEDKFAEYIRLKSMPKVDTRLNKDSVIFRVDEYRNHNSIWSQREITTQWRGTKWGSGHDYLTRPTEVFPRSDGSR